VTTDQTPTHPDFTAPTPWRWTGTLGITGAGHTRSIEIDAQQEGGSELALELPVDQARQLHARLGELLAGEQPPAPGPEPAPHRYVTAAHCDACLRQWYGVPAVEPAAVAPAVDPMEDIDDWGDKPDLPGHALPAGLPRGASAAELS
jgi:hypothetical protein